MKLKVLYLARKNDKNCIILKKFLEKKNIKLKVFWTNKGKNISRANIFKKKYDLIFCYRSYLILNKKEILQAKIAAINIHPGPPKYRGTGCLNYALFNSEKKYGLTIHLIDVKVDSGKIIFHKDFLIGKNDNVEKLLKVTHIQCLKYSKIIILKIIKNVDYIKTLIQKFRNTSWSKNIYNKKYLEKFYEIKIDKKTHDKMYKKIKATYYKDFKPFILINKKKYYINEKR